MIPYPFHRSDNILLNIEVYGTTLGSFSDVCASFFINENQHVRRQEAAHHHFRTMLIPY